MAYIQEHHKEVLGSLIEPFERNKRKSFKTHLKIGEKEEFTELIHPGNKNNPPPQLNEKTVLTSEELIQNNILNGGSFSEKCFLWVIDELTVKMIWEKTPNELRSAAVPERPYVCHTNITGCGKAYLGGEMYFCEDNNIYVNFRSDRYGNPETKEKKQMAIQYMKDCGYKNIIETKFEI